MTVRFIHADVLYDGSGAAPRRDCLIEIREGRIRSVTRAAAPKGARRVEIAAPGFIDLQINGAADVQFNDDPSVAALTRIAEGARRGGTTHLLPTFITAADDAYRQALHAVREALAQKVPGVLGLHLEGPFLSPHRPGIHPAAAIRPATATDLAALEQADIPLLLTLAPEEHPAGTVQRLTDAGVVVFVGHSVATAQELNAAVAEGLRGVTHLWNAMPPPQGRAPGIVGRVLTHPQLFAGIIADGYHVDPLNLTLAARMMPDRLFLVSDAMRTFAGKVTAFDLMGTDVRLCDGRLTGPDGTLAGAHLGMDQAVRVMVKAAGISPQMALIMASTTPARVMGLDRELGRIAAGFRASLTFLSADFRAQGGMVDGIAFG
ncbi:MAG: N-acetylglucosamine-6-phosphate deacetylase [Loktanella sp.]|nr:N-acetylglucosamine-6-phosphate deacetylase [Loktanella sp.]